MAIKPKVSFKFGTKAEYDALLSKDQHTLYFLLDTNELYRGTVPFNTPHVYKGSYGNAANLAGALNNLIGNSPVINGDIAILVNADQSQDSYIWSEDDNEWIHIGNTNTNSLSQRVIALETEVANLDTLLYGDQADPNAENGLVDRVSILESVIANQSGGPIPVFNGTIAGLVPTPDSILTDQEKANRFLNGLGNWITISSGGSGGQSTYVDPEGHTYYTAEEYVTYMINNYGHSEWESIDG